MDGEIKYKSGILRAQDIIPSVGQKSQQANPPDSGIPRFDLATEIMAQQRRLTSSRRKKSENKTQMSLANLSTEIPAVSAAAFAPRISSYDTVIAEIVRRDIQKMLSA